MSQVESDVQVGSGVVVGAGVVVGEAESDPLPHAEVTNRNVRAIAHFLTVGSCHLPMSTAEIAGLTHPHTHPEAILMHIQFVNTRGREKVPTERTTAQ